jgi:type IV pilus assembly protein PilX
MNAFLRASRGQPAAPAQQQKGIALVVGLVILVILALIGTTAYSVATQEERMAGNARDHDRAFQAAEYALRECEHAVILGPTFDPNGAGSPTGMFAAKPTGYWVGDTANWTNVNTYPLNPLDGASRQPSCIAEDFQKGTKLNWSTTKTLIPHTARVTAVGYGITTGTKVTLVSYVNYFSTN